MRRMNFPKSWKGWIIYSVLLVSRISCVKDTTFHICLTENGQGGQTCYTPSDHSMDWSSCIQECKFNHGELATIVDSPTYFDLLLRLLSHHRGVYWIAASRNNTEWRWTNGISLPTQLTEFLGGENHGNCLSWDVGNCTKCLEARECSGSYTCLCQFNERGTVNNRTTSKGTNTTVPFVTPHVNFISSTPYLGSVHAFLTEKTTTLASEITSPPSKASADSSGINITESNSSPRIASPTTAVSTAHSLETDTLPVETSQRFGFPISYANNESDITKTRFTILMATKTSILTPLTQLESNVSKAATAMERTTAEPSTVKHDGFNFSTLLIKSFQALHSTKTWSIVTGATRKQFNETAIYTASFCIPASGGEMCYYYFENRRNQLEAASLCNGFGKEIFHFDNNISTALYVREHLKNISGGVWLGAIKLGIGWSWLYDDNVLIVSIGQKFTDFWTGNIFSTDPNSENTSCLILVPSIDPLARMGCQESYSVLCQDKNGTMRNQTTRKETTVAITMVPSVVTSVRLSSSTHSRQSVVSFLTQKTTTVASEITSHQTKANAATVSPNVTFCRSTMSRDMCYYYYDAHRNQYDAIAFCRGLGMNVFQFNNDNTTAQFVREKLRNIIGGIWLGAIKLRNGWSWISGQNLTDVWTTNIISTDRNSEDQSCLILVPSIERLARMSCQDSYSVLCQGEHVRRPLSSGNESTRVLVTTSPTDKSSVSPFKTSPRTGTSMYNDKNVSNFASRLSVNLTNTEATTSMAMTQFKSKSPTLSSSSSSSSKTTATPTKGSKSATVTGNYSSTQATLIQTPSQLVVTTTNMVTMTAGSMTFPSVANELSTTVSTNTILQSVSNEQSNTVNISKLLENLTTTVVNGETNLTPITLKRPGTPKINTSERNVPLSTQQTNSDVKPTVSLPASPLRTPLHGGTTESILSLSLAYLSTKQEYNFSSTEPNRRFRSQQTTMLIRQSTRMSNAVPTSKHPANTQGLPSDRMEQTSQLPSNSFTSVVSGNKSYVQDISARTLSFTSGSIKDRILPVSTPFYYDSATTTDRQVMSQSNIDVSSQQYASKAVIVGASVGVGFLLLAIILAVIIRKRMGNGKESMRQSDQPLNVCQSNGDYADGYITEFNARFVENPLYGQSEL